MPRRIRRKIKKANQQIKRLTGDQLPGVLVLYCNTALGDYDPQDIHDAMYGNESYEYLVARGGSGETTALGASLGPDRGFTAEKHTSTSAIVSLRGSSASDVALVFYHNHFAKNPINPDWLRAESVWHRASKAANPQQLPSWAEI